MGNPARPLLPSQANPLGPKAEGTGPTPQAGSGSQPALNLIQHREPPIPLGFIGRILN